VKKWKQPAVQKDPPGKSPRIGADIPGADHIIFRFSVIDPDGPFGWREVAATDLWRHIKQRVASVETMTWPELMRGGDNHVLSPEKLSREARQRLEDIHQGDAADQLFSLHVTGRMRIIGIRDRRYFRILWWDPNHAVCPVNK